MAPEQALGKPIDACCDLYALGGDMPGKVIVQNQGNSPQTSCVAFGDQAGELKFSPTQQRIRLDVYIWRAEEYAYERHWQNRAAVGYKWKVAS